MAETEEVSISTSDWKEALYGEALSERTQKTGRVLILVGLATLMVSVFGVSVKNIPGFSLDFSRQPAALEMFLATLNLGLLVSYFLRAFTDYLRAREEWFELVTYLEDRRVKNAYAEAREADEKAERSARGEEEPDWGPDPFYAHAYNIDDDAKQRIAKLEAQIGSRRLPRFVRHLRLWLLGNGPFVIGLLALLHTGGAAWKFLLAVFGVDPNN